MKSNSKSRHSAKSTPKVTLEALLVTSAVGGVIGTVVQFPIVGLFPIVNSNAWYLPSPFLSGIHLITAGYLIGGAIVIGAWLARSSKQAAAMGLIFALTSFFIMDAFHTPLWMAPISSDWLEPLPPTVINFLVISPVVAVIADVTLHVRTWWGERRRATLSSR